VGHSVLVVPVPELDEWIRARTAFYDASFVSADPGFVHAHITLLGPWLPRPAAEDLATAARLARFPRARRTRAASVRSCPI
jgi:hypothetical protein